MFLKEWVVSKSRSSEIDGQFVIVENFLLSRKAVGSTFMYALVGGASTYTKLNKQGIDQNWSKRSYDQNSSRCFTWTLLL